MFGQWGRNRMARVRSYLPKPHADVKTTTTAMIQATSDDLPTYFIGNVLLSKNDRVVFKLYFYSDSKHEPSRDTIGSMFDVCRRYARPHSQNKLCVGDETFELFIV